MRSQNSAHRRKKLHNVTVPSQERRSYRSHRRQPNRLQMMLLTRRRSVSCASCMGKERSMMMTTPLDPSLDVSHRLADLRTWQGEWQHIDRQLEEQVSRLDGNNFLQLQQSVHISNVRRRMAMTLVKEPLSLPESVLK